MKLRIKALALPLFVLGCTTAMAYQGMTFKQALRAVERSGVRNVYKIERDGQFYEVKAVDNTGKKVRYTLDATSGKMMQVEHFEHHGHKHGHKHHHNHNHHNVSHHGKGHGTHSSHKAVRSEGTSTSETAGSASNATKATN